MPANPYDLFARFYDPLRYNEFSIQVVYYLDDLLASLGFSGDRILDLGCGTGTASLWFAQQGYKVTGVDLSGEMLRLAKLKSKQLKANPTFLKKDMRQLNFKHKFDLAISLFDSLNHLTTYSDLNKTVRGVAYSLAPKGYFLFDTITPYELSSQWNGTTRFEQNGPYSLTLCNRYDKKVRLAKIRGEFVEAHKDKLKKSLRYFYNKAYTRTEIKEVLKENGFQLLHMYQCFSFDKPKNSTRRIFYTAQKI